VLLERDRDVCAALELQPELEERAEAERPQRAVELGRAWARGGHETGYAPAGPVPAWQVGHQ
jgi:hypothetical protein